MNMAKNGNGNLFLKRKDAIMTHEKRAAVIGVRSSVLLRVQ